MKILVCGHRSFAAFGLAQHLESFGHTVETFSRGKPLREGGQISGDVYTMEHSDHLASDYDVVINFIIIKQGSVLDNVAYAESLAKFCARIRPRALLHVSSISAFPRSADRVVESTPIAPPGTWRGPYATIKSEVDHALAAACINFPVSFLRPGFITAADSPSGATAGVTLRLIGPLHLLLGDRLTPLPVIARPQLHEAIRRIAEADAPAPSYLLFVNNSSTKLSHAQSTICGLIIPLPRSLTLMIANILRRTGLLTSQQFAQVAGLFCRTHFDCRQTQERLGMVFQ